MTGDAAVEPSDIAEIVVERELWQPDLVDPQRSVEGIQYRQFEQRLSGIGRPGLQCLRQLAELGAMIGERLGRGILSGSQFLERGFERFPMGVGGLKVQRGGRDLRPLRIGERQERHQLLLRCLFGHAQFVVRPTLIELRLPEFERASKQVFAKLRPLGDVTKPLQQVAATHQSLRRVCLRLQLVDVQLGTVGGLGVGRHGANLGQKSLGKGWIKIGPTRLGERRFKLLRLLLERPRVLLVHAGRCRPGLKRPKLPLVLFPGPIVI